MSPTLAVPTIRKYDESEDMIVEDVEFGERKFKTDQGDYFNFKIPLVSSVQSALDVKPEAVSEAEEGMSEQVDTYIGKLMKDGVKNSNKVGTLPLDIEKKDAYKTLVALRKKLNATSVPKTDRFVMVGPEMESALLYDERLDKAVNNSNLLNGEIGRLLGFRIISAPTVPTVAGREVVIAGHPMATSFGYQITEVEESSMLPFRFTRAITGLQVYGGSVIRPEALATAEQDVAEPTTAGATE
ncbi:hypothetical protein [Corynebacterium sp. NML130628]|uniref:hypothetical protein n=1 Tax=Corynebacterium sp. NML130628 TaxID=1906333 RepID=UPI0011601241|nr:hypothetical protein [Corynebacterium sp. NML130628]